MFFVVFDENLRHQTLKITNAKSDLVNILYSAIRKNIDKVLSKSPDIPAKFASKVFFSDNFWDYSMEIRVVPAILSLLIAEMKLPLWVSWADLELNEEIVRLVFLFSSKSEVKGIPGRVLVAQFSDDDRLVSLDFEGNKLQFSTLYYTAALLIAIKKLVKDNEPIESIIPKFESKVDSVLKSVLPQEKVAEETKKEEIKVDFTDLEEELKKLGDGFGT